MSSYEALRYAVNGDIPEPTVFAYDDDDGANIDIDGYTGTVTFRVDDEDSTTRAAVVDEEESTVTVTWQDGDHDIASNGTGLLKGEVAVLAGSTAFWQRSFQRVILPRLGG